MLLLIIINDIHLVEETDHVICRSGQRVAHVVLAGIMLVTMGGGTCFKMGCTSAHQKTSENFCDLNWQL